jgi:hypothetical protein
MMLLDDLTPNLWHIWIQQKFRANTTTFGIFAPQRKVLEAEEVAAQPKVKAEVEQWKPPNPGKAPVAKTAGKVATTTRVKNAKLARRLGEKLCDKMPRKLAEMGLTVEFEVVFQEGPYVVIQLQVQHVNARAIERSQRQENADPTADEGTPSDTAVAATLLEWCLKIIGPENQRTLEESYLPVKVQTKLESKIMEVMAEKVGRKGLKAIADSKRRRTGKILL